MLLHCLLERFPEAVDVDVDLLVFIVGSSVHICQEVVDVGLDSACPPWRCQLAEYVVADWRSEVFVLMKRVKCSNCVH